MRWTGSGIEHPGGHDKDHARCLRYHLRPDSPVPTALLTDARDGPIEMYVDSDGRHAIAPNADVASGLIRFDASGPTGGAPVYDAPDEQGDPLH